MESQSSLVSVDLVRAAQRSEEYFKGADVAQLQTAIDRYTKFLQLAARHPDRRLAPTREIDHMWHLHMLHATRRTPGRLPARLRLRCSTTTAASGPTRRSSPRSSRRSPKRQRSGSASSVSRTCQSLGRARRAAGTTARAAAGTHAARSSARAAPRGVLPRPRDRAGRVPRARGLARRRRRGRGDRAPARRRLVRLLAWAGPVPHRPPRRHDGRVVLRATRSRRWCLAARGRPAAHQEAEPGADRALGTAPPRLPTACRWASAPGAAPVLVLRVPTGTGSTTRRSCGPRSRTPGRSSRYKSSWRKYARSAPPSRSGSGSR